MEQTDNSQVPLSIKRIKTLFLYYIVLILVGITAVTFLIMDKLAVPLISYNFSIFNTAIIVSLFSAILGSSIHYIRKLYKGCINNRFIEPTSEKDRQYQLGILHYYMLRPIFSVAFALLFILACRAGFSFLVKYSEPKTEFIFFSAFITFFIGYSSGDVIDKFDSHGKKLIDKYYDKL